MCDNKNPYFSNPLIHVCTRLEIKIVARGTQAAIVYYRRRQYVSSTVTITESAIARCRTHSDAHNIPEGNACLQRHFLDVMYMKYTSRLKSLVTGSRQRLFITVVDTLFPALPLSPTTLTHGTQLTVVHEKMFEDYACDLRRMSVCLWSVFRGKNLWLFVGHRQPLFITVDDILKIPHCLHRRQR